MYENFSAWAGTCVREKSENNQPNNKLKKPRATNALDIALIKLLIKIKDTDTYNIHSFR